MTREPNSPATGTPTISGVTQVGSTLTVDTSPILDTDGLPSSFEHQWVRIAENGTETNIAGANAATYTLVAADAGNTIKVVVSFTDNANHDETVPSDPVGPVAPAAGDCITGYDWCAAMTVQVNTDELGEITFAGYHHTGIGTLDPDTISYGIKRFETFVVNWTPDSPMGFLKISFHVTLQNSGHVPRGGSVFRFNEIERTADVGEVLGDFPGEYTWNDIPADFGWDRRPGGDGKREPGPGAGERHGKRDDTDPDPCGGSRHYFDPGGRQIYGKSERQRGADGFERVGRYQDGDADPGDAGHRHGHRDGGL